MTGEGGIWLVQVTQLILVVLSAVGFWISVHEIRMIHKSVNSRVDALLDAVGKAQYAAGREYGRDERGNLSPLEH